eukprot:5143856-Prymnesium_polylepis.1
MARPPVWRAARRSRRRGAWRCGAPTGCAARARQRESCSGRPSPRAGRRRWSSARCACTSGGASAWRS